MKTLGVSGFITRPVKAIHMKREEYAQIAVALIMIATMSFGRTINYPDNVHKIHGLPLTWGTHQLVTIAGSVDTWTVEITNIVIDLLIWNAIILVIPYLIKSFSKPEMDE